MTHFLIRSWLVPKMLPLHLLLIMLMLPHNRYYRQALVSVWERHPFESFACARDRSCSRWSPMGTCQALKGHSVLGMSLSNGWLSLTRMGLWYRLQLRSNRCPDRKPVPKPSNALDLLCPKFRQLLFDGRILPLCLKNLLRLLALGCRLACLWESVKLSLIFLLQSYRSRLPSRKPFVFT